MTITSVKEKKRILAKEKAENETIKPEATFQTLGFRDQAEFNEFKSFMI